MVVVSSSGTVATYNAGSMAVISLIALAELDPGSAYFEGDKLLLVTERRKLTTISMSGGSRQAPIDAGHPITSLSVIEDDIIWGDVRGNIVRFDVEKSAVSWRFRNGAGISSLISTKRGIVAASLDNFVYLVSNYNGNVRWKKRMPGRVSAVVVDGDIAIVQTVGESNAVLLNLENGKSIGSFSIGGMTLYTPTNVCRRPDHFLWHRAYWAQNPNPCGRNKRRTP